MLCEFKVTRRVEFSETDMAGIMHFSNFFKFMETAEHAFFRSLGYSIHTVLPDGMEVGWPRVRAECSYSAPVRFEDEVEIHLLVQNISRKSITYDFIFRRLNGEEDQEVARGALTVVCVAHNGAGKMQAIPIPAAIAEKIKTAPQYQS